MPPKKAAGAPSKKADEKKKAKVIEDKTFGLKNKKGAKQQKYIQQTINQVKTGNQPKKAATDEPANKKELKKKELDELNMIFRPVATQKVAQGVDPKSVLCAFFKQGQCTKGDKCKFSHDLTIERKAEKRSLYFDERGEKKEEDTMEDWDEEKLAEVVAKKHGEREKALPPTSIICKHFLDAIENNKYGWFWECPNGGLKCHYRHALPPGFVLKKDQKKREKGEEITIEELVEIERSKLGSNLTKITLESFLAWKKKKIAEKQKKDREDTDKKKAQFKAGKSSGLSGREMFTFNPELARDSEMDEGEAAMDIIREQDEDDDVQVKEIDLDAMAQLASEADSSGTQVDSTAKRDFGDVPKTAEASSNGEPSTSTGSDQPDGDTINEPIDESLFDDDALDGLEDELEGVQI